MKKLIYLLCLLSCTVFVCAQKSLTIEFKDAGRITDNDTHKISSLVEVVSSGAEYLDSVSAVNVYNGKQGHGIKIGMASATGGITLHFAEKHKPVLVIYEAAAWLGETGKYDTMLAINEQQQVLSSEIKYYSYACNGDSIDSLVVASGSNKQLQHRFYLKSITLYELESAGDPYLLVCPPSLKMSAIETFSETQKLIVAAGNLWNDVSLSFQSASSTLSVSPTSITNAGTIFQEVSVTYSPTAVSVDDNVLRITSGELAQQVSISAKALPFPAGYVYERVDDVSSLQDGDVVIFYEPTNGCANGEFNTSKLMGVTVHDLSNVFEKIVPLTLKRVDSKWQFLNSAGAALGVKYNKNQSNKLNFTSPDIKDWTIDINAGVATITCDTMGTMRYNSGYFTNYTSSTGKTIQLYRKKSLKYTVSTSVLEGEGSVTQIAEKVERCDTVHLVAQPAEGYEFVEWDNGAKTAEIDVVVASDTLLQATFQLKQYIVSSSVNVDSMGLVSITPVQDFYSHGSEITIVAEPAIHHHFVKWNDGNTDVSRTLVVKSDISLRATFAIDRFEVKFVDYNGASLKVDSVNYGANAVAPGNPSREGYDFSGWEGSFEDVTADVVVTAQYSIKQYTVTIQANDPTMGSVTEGGQFDYGTKLEVSAVPADGYEFVSWSDGGAQTHEITVGAADMELVATFRGSTVGVEEVTALNIYSHDGTIFVDNTFDFTIYNIVGQDVTSENGRLHGVYVVKVAGKAHKVNVK